MRIKVLAVLAFASACGDDATSNQRLDGGLIIPDATEFAPQLTSFTATPNSITGGVPTDVEWNWTYLNDPTFPDPTCTIDNGVGVVTRGQTTSVTLTQVTQFTLTCVNTQGMASRITVVSVPPVAPSIASFTVSPTSIAPNTSQNYTFTWTYSNTPTPPPTCYVDGASTNSVTSGSQISVTLPQARMFRLRCTNGAGTATADASVAVNECGTAAAQCGPNTNCNENPTGYTCSCASGYTPSANDPNVCNFVTAVPGDCDANATHNGTSCQCVGGYIGSGQNGFCQKARLAFVTSFTANGQIFNNSSWTGQAGPPTPTKGLESADNVCAAQATNAGLSGTFKAWLSDQTDDAYCRIAGYSGKKSANCGQTNLPTLAGPWVRTNPANANGTSVLARSQAFAPTIDKLLAPTNTVYYPASYTASGSQTSVATKVWTGTSETGEYTTNACGDWASTGVRGTTGLAHGGSKSWTKETGATTLDTTCTSSAGLLCMEVVQDSTGPALPTRFQSAAKKAFLTSVTGNGQLTSWADAHGVTTGIAGTYAFYTADEICKSRARYAGYANANTFKAWFTIYSFYIYDSTYRIVTSASPYARPDGVVIGTSRSDLLSYSTVTPQLDAAWNQTELGTYITGDVDSGFAWTNSRYDGRYYSSSSTSTCNSYLAGTNTYQGVLAKFGMLDDRYIGGGYNFTASFQTCDQQARLYCVEDQ